MQIFTMFYTTSIQCLFFEKFLVFEHKDAVGDEEKLRKFADVLINGLFEFAKVKYAEERNGIRFPKK